MIRIAVADAHATRRWALREALATVSDFAVVGDVGSAEELMRLLPQTRPDVLLLDLELPDQRAIDLLEEVRALEVAPLVVVLALEPAPGIAARAMAQGWVSWAAPPEQLQDAIRAVVRGERVVPPELDELLGGHRALTSREQEIMEMLGRGMTSREVAEHLAISIKTVDSHRGHILKKLGLRNNSDLTRFAVRHGYVSL